MGCWGCQIVSAIGIFLQLRACGDLGPLFGAVGGVFKPYGMARTRKVLEGRCQSLCRSSNEPFHYEVFAMPTTLTDAADAFYAAGNQMLAGDLSGFEAIWSKADDISHLGPTGAIRIGRSAVMEEFAREAAMGFEGTLRADDRQFVESPDMGYLICVERTSGMTKVGE